MTAPSRLTNCTFLANSLSFNGPCHHGNLIYILGLPSTIPLVFSFRRCSGPDELPSQWWLCQRCDNMCHWLPRGLQEQRLWMWRSVQQYGCSDFAISCMQDTNNISHIMFIQTIDSLRYRRQNVYAKRVNMNPSVGRQVRWSAVGFAHVKFLDWGALWKAPYF